MTSFHPMYWPLSAFKTQEITDIVKHVAYSCHLLYIHFRLRTAHCLSKRNYGMGLRLVASVAYWFKDVVDFLCFERR